MKTLAVDIGGTFIKFGLVDEQHRTTLLHEPTGKVHDAVSLEIEAVEVDIETLTQLGVKVLLGILQEEGSPSHATRALDANHAIAPVYRIHQRAAHGSIEMLHQVGV